ncbi:MAG: ribonuclease E/G, partial [Micrococcales bacterium]|nr:ribonuclease E/G [Micrococcales bacterium]
PEDLGVIVRTAAEGTKDEEIKADLARLLSNWQKIQDRAAAKKANAPTLLKGEPDLAIRVVRDLFSEDFKGLEVSGETVWTDITEYLSEVAPELRKCVTKWTAEGDIFAASRVEEQLAKGLDRKVWLPSGGSLVIDKTEAMTVIDVNTGKFTGEGGTLEETVTRNNLEAAEEIVRQLRLRDIGGIIVIDFIDMVLESNRDLVLRRLAEALARDRTRHQVAEVTSLGLVQMTRKRVGQGLLEAFSDTCDCCGGRGYIVRDSPLDKTRGSDSGAETGAGGGTGGGKRKKRGGKKNKANGGSQKPSTGSNRGTDETVSAATVPPASDEVKATLASIAAAAAQSRGA